MIRGASRWLEPNAPIVARRPVAIAAARARVRTAGLRIARSLVEDRGRPVLRACAPHGSKTRRKGVAARIIRSVSDRPPGQAAAVAAPAAHPDACRRRRRGAPRLLARALLR